MRTVQVREARFSTIDRRDIVAHSAIAPRCDAPRTPTTRDITHRARAAHTRRIDRRHAARGAVRDTREAVPRSTHDLGTFAADQRTMPAGSRTLRSSRASDYTYRRPLSAPRENA